STAVRLGTRPAHRGMGRSRSCRRLPPTKEILLMWPFSARRIRRAQPVRRVSPSHQPRLEALEDRCLLSAGALDPTFGNGAGYVTADQTTGQDIAEAVLIQPDGKIVAAGLGSLNSHSGVSGPEVFTVARFNTTGSLDTSFGSGGTAVVNFGPTKTKNGDPQ